MTASVRTVYKTAIIKWGELSQIIVAIEELSELQKALCKYYRAEMGAKATFIDRKDALVKIDEEMADVKIMLEQLTLIFGNDGAIRQHYGDKIARLRQTLELSDD